MAAADRNPAKGVRSLVRRAALTTLSWQGRATGSTLAALRRKRVHFLYLHSVFEHQEEGFRSLLERLAEDHRFISYSEATRRVIEGDIDAPYVTFSFDDGFVSCLRAARILGEFGAAAAFFVCPKLVECGTVDQVRRVFGVGTEEVVEATMNWNQLAELKSEGHEIGSHTLSHSNLAGATANQLDEEIGGSFEALRVRLGGVEHFAWPYGRFAHFSPAAAARVFETGFETCASAERGCHTETLAGNRRQLCIRRENVEPTERLDHSLFFIGRTSRGSDADTNLWPAEWRPHI